jgi:uncharacterized protein (TIGR02117 family)
MLSNLYRLLKSILKYTGNILLAFLVLVIAYLIFTIILTIIPSNMFSEQPKEGIIIYIKSNGVHTDLVLPMENKFYDWNEKISTEDFALDTINYKWVAFGWGNRGFYLETPAWSDLKISTAINAMFRSRTVMHVSIHGNTIKENKYTKKIILTEEQYLILCEYIFNSFQRNEEGNFILINCCHYNGVNDNFYEAVGNYHALNSCNNWANRGLKTAGVRTALWAPFDKCIFYHFE